MSEVIEFKNEKTKKTIANCKPSEFLRQTYRMKEAVEQWLKLTDIITIIKRVAPQTAITETMTDAEKAKVIASNLFSRKEQFNKNVSEVLKVAMYEHPEETIKILGMCCFIEPEDADNYEMSFYFDAITELVASKAVRDFFISLVKWGQKNTQSVSEA